MSSFWITFILLICLSSLGRLEEDEEEEESLIRKDRICTGQKDYVDASVMFEKSFRVIVDQLFYDFSWDYPPFSYMSEGVHEVFLKEFDSTWDKPQERLKRGHYLGGFYHYPIYQEVGDIFGLNNAPQNGNKTLNLEEYSRLCSSKQVVFFKDEHYNKDKYHIKIKNESKFSLIEIPEYLSFSGIPSRGSIENFLLFPKEVQTTLPSQMTSLPTIFDFIRHTLYVIINQKEANSVPRLYYNTFKYRESEDFKKNWKNVSIPKGFRYNAFIPSAVDMDETLYYRVFKYNVIAEPFRNTKKDKTRGPSFLFELEFDETGKPSLKRLSGNGMSLFECKFTLSSSRILYWVFGTIVTVLLIIIVLMLGFVFFSYMTGKDRMVIVKKRRAGKGISGGGSHRRSISLDRTRMSRKPEADEKSDHDHDRRSATESIEDKKTTTSDKKIRI